MAWNYRKYGFCSGQHKIPGISCNQNCIKVIAKLFAKVLKTEKCHSIPLKENRYIFDSFRFSAVFIFRYPAANDFFLAIIMI